MNPDEDRREEGEQAKKSQGGASDCERLEALRRELAELVDDICDLPQVLGRDLEYPRQTTECAPCLHCVVRPPGSEVSNT